MPRKRDEPTPAELWAEADDLERQAERLRREAITVALQRKSGRVGAAAALLPMSRSGLRNILDSDGRYPDLGEMAAGLRARAGYGTGRPPDELLLEEDSDA